MERDLFAECRQKVAQMTEVGTINVQVRDTFFRHVDHCRGDNRTGISGESIQVIRPDLIVFLGCRSQWGGSGGIGYFDQVHVIVGARHQQQEWQWRDQYDQARDRWDLRIRGIGEIKIEENAGQLTVTIELQNDQSGNRSATFTFDQRADVEEASALSAEDQSAFETQVAVAVESMMSDLKRRHARRPLMVASYPTGWAPSGAPTHVPYAMPQVVQQLIQSRLGVAVFVTCEQIDHNFSTPQMRYKAHLVQWGEAVCREVYEEHRYEDDNCRIRLSIVSLSRQELVLLPTRGSGLSSSIARRRTPVASPVSWSIAWISRHVRDERGARSPRSHRPQKS